MATTDTNLPQLVINVGTQAQIEAAIQAGTITADMLSITTDGAGYAEQLSSLPAASSSLEGVIYQYIGSTGGGYTKGCFYECVDDSGTYYWKEVLALPDQTGNNGKFLKTDGDTVSWAQGVENYGPQTQDLIIGNSAHTKNTNINYANVKSKQNNIGIIELGIELDNINTLRKVIACIQSLPDVYSVKRVQTSFSHAPEQFAKKNVKKKPPKNKKPHQH